MALTDQTDYNAHLTQSAKAVGRVEFSWDGPGHGLGSITIRCSGKWARTQRPDPGDGGNRAEARLSVLLCVRSQGVRGKVLWVLR